MQSARTPDHAIEPLFLKRWSPRSFDATSMPIGDLLSILEAGRWAPSAYNVQPWRFLYAARADNHWPDFLTLLDPFNQHWAKDASALIFLASETVMPADENRPEARSNYHSFDAGAAWMQMALQATALGYAAHAMAGLNFEDAPAVLNLPDRFAVQIGIAIGHQGHAEHLPEDLKARELPSGRMPLGHISRRGPFADPFGALAAE